MRTLAVLVASIGIVCASVAGTTVADAQQHRGSRGHSRSQRSRRGRGQHYGPYNPIPGIVGGIFGGWLAGKMQQQDEPEPREENGLEPFTPEWHRYCADKYKSFDPETGFFNTYGGKKVFCK